ncbi:CRISPR subtype II/NMENI RNA-guided endonuclease Cas9/Csn1 [Chryseobacterium taeanense]|uniref:CRISPR-associated endonuclease Cas9 n=1 Tax=Chryseobacterium taeanense TaxID=311334 RepID=A0A1G8KAU6_9FLAO|nr:type II CRISPR RNA-guided endonuclease Cas9 [Chryseobacterium taeanense]SDI40544.1 CRISPR subtype II/NMENI RNA-guided endonuclease Cas9/Csn1 [Chryseobacterium taeanense]
MTKHILGLDLGTNSIGWALVKQDFDNKQGEILGMGSRIIPMGTDKQDYEKGIGITKNADRRTKRTIRKMNKRYKLRRNKLLYILHELEMLPEQFQFKNGIPEPNKIQELELLPIKKGMLQLDSLTHYKLRANAIDYVIDIKDFGKILYQFNQLRGYSGGNNEENTKNKQEDNFDDENESVKKYEVITQKVLIQNVELSDTKFKGRGKNKDLEFNKFNVTVLLDDEELEGETELQNLSEKINQEEELEIRIRRNKKAETTSVVFALPQKTNWRKQMEKTEEDLKQSNLLVSQLFVKDLEQNKWTKIRNRVILRNRYQEEFDAIWKTQSNYYSFLNDCAKDKLEKIANYLFPGKSESQGRLRKEAINGGLKYIIKNQVIYYQRPLKPQTELISKCQFEKEETVLPNSHPLFQEFRCWDQINRMYITSKQEVWNERKGKTVFQYSDRFLTTEQKQQIYQRLQIQKQVSFSDVAKIINLKSDKTEYLNGLNAKTKLKGCDTVITIKKALGEHFDELYLQDNFIVNNLWKAIFDNANNGNEYDVKSPKVSSIIEVLKPLNNNELVTEMALRIAQTIKFPRKYSSLSEKAIINILPLMQLNPSAVTERVKANFENIEHLIETGEILDDNLLEDYVISFVKNNPNAFQTGGFMYAFASSLVYGRHTQENIKPQIKDYHDIKYAERNLRNPIVSQLANETMQIVKSLWKQHQFNPEELEIRIELARDLKNSAAERDKIFKGQIKSQRINDSIKKRLQQENIPITDRNILKYKLYEQQKFMSPYTKNKIIPFSSLFDDRLYDIDHIIPKSRYFDDSLSNKVVCETHINEEKSNRTAWEYISQQNSRFDVCSESEYVQFVNDTFYGKKKKNLLLEKIPKDLVERSIKDTQYISVAVKNELAKIVGSENVKTTTGEVTDFLRSRWGLRDLFMRLTKERFKQMELWDINPETSVTNEEWVKMEFDERKNKKVLRIKNWSKRYDHRHHAIDALVVALTQQSHIQRLNNLNKYLQDELIKRKEEFHLEIKEGETVLETFFNLEESRREEIQKQIESSRFFDKPFDGLIEQAKNHLEAMTVSIKPKDKLGVKKNDEGKLQLKIRGALHQETNYGKTKDPKTKLLRDTKTIDLSNLKAKDIPQIIDEVLQKEVDAHKNKYESVKEAFTGEGLKAFNETRFQTKQPGKQKPPVYKVKVWYSNKETEESTLQRLYKNNEKLSVVTGDNYLFLVMEKDTKKGKERVFDIASLYDSADIAKSSLKDNDENFKQKISEAYRLTYGERNKLRGKIQENPDRVLFTLQQNDLVYLPENREDRVLSFSNEELKNWLSDIENKKVFSKRIYKVAKFGGKDCHFIPHNYANVISIPKDLSDEQKEILKEQYKGKAIPKKELNFMEFGSYRDCSPYEAGEVFTKSLTTDKNNKKSMVKPLKIQDTCIKLNIDWLGNVSKV